MPEPRRSGRLLADLMKDRRGAVAILLALTLPMLIGMLALGVETALWFNTRRSLQTAADSAAIAGAYELSLGQSGYQTAASADATRNGFTAGGGATIVTNSPPTTGAYAGNAGAVEVTISQPQSLLLAQMFMNSLTITTRAVALVGTGGAGACVIALDPTDQNAVWVSGTANLSASSCSVQSKSNNSTKSINVGGSGVIDAYSVVASGGIYGTDSINATTITENADSSKVVDPYSSLSVPAHSACNKHSSSTSLSGTQTVGTVGGTTVYCGLSINAGANITFNSGTYIIDTGDMTVNGSATISGEGVVFIITASDGSSFGNLTINGGAVVNLSAPTSGTFSGVAFYHDRNDTSSTNNDKFNGNGISNIEGAIYNPSGTVDYSGTNSSTGSCTYVVANMVKIVGNSNLGSSCNGIPTSVGSGVVQLVE
jgi:Flp pilus assembly protein TadG